jgi:hypothetical protein
VLVVLRSPAVAAAASSKVRRASKLSAALGATAAPPSPDTPESSGAAAVAGAALAAAGGGGAAGSTNHLVPVPLPVGSVRASLGTLSTFEDCYALVKFLGSTFMNFTVHDEDVLLGVKMVCVCVCHVGRAWWQHGGQHTRCVRNTLLVNSAAPDVPRALLCAGERVGSSQPGGDGGDAHQHQQRSRRRRRQRHAAAGRRRPAPDVHAGERGVQHGVARRVVHGQRRGVVVLRDLMWGR